MGLGANIGNRLSCIDAAIKKLGESLESLSVSLFYETAPMDFLDQADFLNTVVRGETSIPALELLDLIHGIEADGGRKRGHVHSNGPRTIDIDILLYDSFCRTYTKEDGSLLIIPHRQMHERLFVLRPLLDLDPDLADPRDSILWKEKASHLWKQRVKLYKR